MCYYKKYKNYDLSFTVGNEKEKMAAFTHFIYTESIAIVSLLYSSCIHHACYGYNGSGHD